MFTAIYKDKIICSFNVKNKYRNYEIEIYEEYKKAGQTGLLKCEECGTPVYLKAGNIKVPHFAHKDSNRSCFFESHKNESEEQVKGKFILYKWLAEQYGNVYIDKKYDNRRANVSIEAEKGIVVLQYIRNERSLNEWNEKREDYLKLGIKDLYFFSFKEFNKENKISEEQFRKIVQKYSNDNMIKMLNTDKNELLLMRYIDFNDKDNKLFYSRLFSKSYNIYNVKLTLDGIIESDFEDEYKIAFENHREIAREQYSKMVKEKKLAEELIKKQLMQQNYKKQIQLEKAEKEKSDKNKKNEKINSSIIFGDSNGYAFDELKYEVKQIITNNPEKAWWQGNTRWVLCKKCKRYYTTDKCVSYGGLKIESTLGICYNCDSDRKSMLK